MHDWNPDLYIQFRAERTQPSIDLVSRIDFAEPQTIIDIGCGPGNSSQILAQRWPEAQITGLDSSPAMIEKARQDYPDQQWVVADANTYSSAKKFDILFSNAVIQWLPDHENLLKRFHGLVAENGLLAIQIPLFNDMPLARVIEETAANSRWQADFTGLDDLFTIEDVSFYYDHLSQLFPSVSLWQTDYIHIMKNHAAIQEMMRSTGLKPYLERLESETERAEFERKIVEGIERAYPGQENGQVLFPFKRLFLIGDKRKKTEKCCPLTSTLNSPPIKN
jgi:trans-aconitate 2-methyltransferase